MFSLQAISEWAKSKTLQQQRQFLPVYDCRDELLQVIRENQVVVVVGETGSGKTTQASHATLTPPPSPLPPPFLLPCTALGVLSALFAAFYTSQPSPILWHHFCYLPNRYLMPLGRSTRLPVPSSLLPVAVSPPANSTPSCHVDVEKAACCAHIPTLASKVLHACPVCGPRCCLFQCRPRRCT